MQSYTVTFAAVHPEYSQPCPQLALEHEPEAARVCQAIAAVPPDPDKGAIAEYARAKILERTRRGRMHKVREGRMLPFETTPYGYAIVGSKDVSGGTVAIDEAEARSVRAMHSWVLDEGMSARQVAKCLNASVPPS